MKIDQFFEEESKSIYDFLTHVIHHKDEFPEDLHPGEWDEHYLLFKEQQHDERRGSEVLEAEIVEGKGS